MDKYLNLFELGVCPWDNSYPIANLHWDNYSTAWGPASKLKLFSVKGGNFKFSIVGNGFRLYLFRGKLFQTTLNGLLYVEIFASDGKFHLVLVSNCVEVGDDLRFYTLRRAAESGEDVVAVIHCVELPPNHYEGYHFIRKVLRCL